VILPNATGLSYLIDDDALKKTAYSVPIKKNEELLTKPQFISMKITNRCQLQCNMCDIWQQESVPELECGQWQKIITDVYNWTGPFRFDIAGGEPLLRNDLEEIIHFASDMVTESVMLTNGALITKKRAKKLLDSNLDTISISLDSLNSSLHDELRGIPGTFQKVKAGISYLKKLRPQREKDMLICMSVIIMASNLKDLIDMSELVKKGETDRICFQALDHNFHAPYDPVWFITNKYWINDTDLLFKVIDQLVELIKQGYPINNTVEQMIYLKWYFSEPDRFNREVTCVSGDKNFIINTNGDVHLCWNLPPVGNVLKNSPESIWNSRIAGERRRDIKKCKRTCRISNCHFKAYKPPDFK